MVGHFIALMERLPAGRDLPAGAVEQLRAIPQNFSVEQAQKVKETEKVTNHDIKAVEYFIKEQFDTLGLVNFKEWVHFALTSQDINNTSIPMLLKDSINKVYLPSIAGPQGLIQALNSK